MRDSVLPRRLNEYGSQKTCNTEPQKLRRDDQEDSSTRVGIHAIVQSLGSQDLSGDGIGGSSRCHNDNKCMLLAVEWERVQESQKSTFPWNEGQCFTKSISNDRHEDDGHIDSLGLEVVDFLEDRSEDS